jgi:hypothetical protein
MRRQAARLAWRWLACALCVLAAPRARASYEEFSTLDVGREEEDDENLLDHVLVRPPAEWVDEWRAAKGGFRTSEGCFTAAQWYLDHELKLQVPMGDTTYLDLGIRDVSDDESTYGWTQFDQLRQEPPGRGPAVGPRERANAAPRSGRDGYGGHVQQAVVAAAGSRRRGLRALRAPPL